MNSEQLIRDWFSKHGGGSLKLPDGWFGRPYDNIHRLTNLELDSNGIHLTLDSSITLDITSPILVVATKESLQISGFQEAKARLPIGERVFDSGTIEIFTHQL